MYKQCWDHLQPRVFYPGPLQLLWAALWGRGSSISTRGLQSRLMLAFHEIWVTISPCEKKICDLLQSVYNCRSKIPRDLGTP